GQGCDGPFRRTPGQGGVRERTDLGHIGRARRAGAPAARGGCGCAVAGRGVETSNRSAVRLRCVGGRRTSPVRGIRVSAAPQRAVPGKGRVDLGGRPALRGRLRWRDVADRRAALLRGGRGAGARACRGDETDLRAARGEGGACLRCDGGDRVALGARADRGHAAGGLGPDGNGPATRCGAGGAERNEPATGELPGDPMKRRRTTGLWLIGAAVMLTGCASAGARPAGGGLAPGGGGGGGAGGRAHPPPRETTELGQAREVGAALASVVRDSAADQTAL